MYDNEARECPFGGYRFELDDNEKAGEKEHNLVGILSDGGYQIDRR